MICAVAELANGHLRKHCLRERICPASVLAMVVGLCLPKGVGFGAHLPAHAEGRQIARKVALGHVVSLFFDVGLLGAICGRVLAVALAELPSNKTVPAES